MVLIAKDGIYLSKPRKITKMIFLPSSRADVAIKCGRTSHLSRGAERIATIETQDIQQFVPDLDMDDWSFTPPPFLKDLRSTNTQYMPFTLFIAENGLINGQTFNGLTSPIRQIFQYSVEEWSFDTCGHPIHLHVHPMQLQEDANDGWSFAGDFVDSVERVRINFQIEGPAMIHCHIDKHSDNGMMAVIQVSPTSQEALDTTLFDNSGNVDLDRRNFFTVVFKILNLIPRSAHDSLKSMRSCGHIDYNEWVMDKQHGDVDYYVNQSSVLVDHWLRITFILLFSIDHSGRLFQYSFPLIFDD